jgi:hypothetical protein
MHIEQQEKWPNFFIVGAPRCGTTSLYSYLKEVPGVYMPRVKEPFYFSPNLVQGWHHPERMVTDKEQYLGLFKNAKGYIAVGEASPSYLWDPDSPKLIHEAVPHARIIILLRDPIDRAYSHYLLHMKTWAPARRSSFADHLTRGDISQLDLQFGMYYEQVKRYLEIFGTEQVKVIIFEEFIQHLEQTVNEVLSFLGINYTVDAMRLKEDNAYSVPRSPLSLWVYAFFRWLRARGINTSRIRILVGDSAILVLEKSLLKGTEKLRIEAKAEEFLRQLYYDDVIRLQSLLGRPLPWGTVLGHEKNNKNTEQRFDYFS